MVQGRDICTTAEVGSSSLYRHLQYNDFLTKLLFI